MSESSVELAECMAHESDGEETAPAELLAEFLSAIMSGRYSSALHYCRLILRYEPHNSTANGLRSLLEERARQVDSEDTSASSSLHSDNEDVVMELGDEEEDTEDERDSSLEETSGSKPFSSSSGGSEESDNNGNRLHSRTPSYSDIHNDNATADVKSGGELQRLCARLARVGK